MELLFVALGPSLLWMWWFSKHNPEKADANNLAVSFFYGALSFLAAIALETVLHKLIPANWAIGPFIITAPVEELCKFTAVRFAVHRDKAFSRPSEGIVYAAAAALGFAFSENIRYFASASLDPGIVFIRLASSVPAHVLFAVPYGAALGNMRCSENFSRVQIFQALFLAIFFHGCFDAVLLGIHKAAPIFLLLFLALMETLWLTYRRKVSELKEAETQPKAVRDIQLEFLSGPLKWNWVAIKTLSGLSAATIVIIALPAVLNVLGIEPNSQLNMTVLVGTLFLAGAGGAYFASGPTIRESAIALFWVGAIFGYFLHSGRDQLITWTAGLAVLGGFAGWFGDALRSRHGQR